MILASLSPGLVMALQALHFALERAYEHLLVLSFLSGLLISDSVLDLLPVLSMHGDVEFFEHVIFGV